MKKLKTVKEIRDYVEKEWDKFFDMSNDERYDRYNIGACNTLRILLDKIDERNGEIKMNNNKFEWEKIIGGREEPNVITYSYTSTQEDYEEYFEELDIEELAMDDLFEEFVAFCKKKDIFNEFLKTVDKEEFCLESKHKDNFAEWLLVNRIERS